MGAIVANNQLQIQNNGTTLGFASIENFTGAGVTVTMNGNKATINIPGPSGSVWLLNGNTNGAEKYIGTNDAFDFPIYTNGTRRATFTSAGDLGYNTVTPLSTVHIVTPSTDSLTKDSLILSHVNTGVLPAVETGLRFKVWINNFANDSARIFSSSTSISSGDQLLNFQTLGIGSSLQTFMTINARYIQCNTQIYTTKYTLTDGATIALDWLNGNVQYVVLGGNRTFTFATPKDGAIYYIILKQDATGGRTVTWPAELSWITGAAPILKTAANAVDVIQLVYDATNTKYYAQPFVQNNSTVATLTDAATVNWAYDINYNATVTLGGNRTLAITGVYAGAYGTLKVVQDATGSRTLTLPAGSKVVNGGAGAVTLTTTANAIDIITFYYDGTNYFWNVGLNYT